MLSLVDRGPLVVRRNTQLLPTIDKFPVSIYYNG